MGDEDSESTESRCIQVYYDIESDETHECFLSTEDAKTSETELESAISPIRSQKSTLITADNDPLASDCSGSDRACDSGKNPTGESPTDDQLQCWTEVPTKLLITLYKNLSPKVGVTLKSKKKMWEAIKIELNKHQYKFSVIQIENRWKTLERAFRRFKTGQGRGRCPYENELADCLFPEFTLGAKGEEKAILDSRSSPTGDFPSSLLELEYRTEHEHQSWTEGPTKLLIRLYNNLSPKVGKTVRLKSKRKMWEVIKNEMDKHRYHYSVLQIENKWKTLERALKRKAEAAKKAALGRVRHPFKKESTEFTLGVKGKGNANRIMQLDSEIDLQEPSQECKNESRFSTPSNHKRFKIDENQATTAPTTEQARGVAMELKKLRMLKGANHNKMLLAYQERTAEIKRRNDLLERLISTLAK